MKSASHNPLRLFFHRESAILDVVREYPVSPRLINHLSLQPKFCGHHISHKRTNILTCDWLNEGSTGSPSDKLMAKEKGTRKKKYAQKNCMISEVAVAVDSREKYIELFTSI